MLHSDWLLAMMEKSGSTPEARALALFDILEDWLQAPRIRANLTTDDAYAGAPEPLLAYLSRQAAAAGRPDPEALAHQIYCLAAGALQRELAAPGSGTLAGARHAAAVLLRAQAQPGKRTRVHAVAASAAGLAMLAALALPSGEATQPALQSATAPAPPGPAGSPGAMTRVAARQPYSPDQIATLHHALERIRQGDCQYPQALMLAPEYRAVLLENVVHGVVPAEAGQIRDTQLLAQKVECYYAPVAMTAM